MAREPATPDVRLMRDFADMRPVDIARAYGYQRIAALLDPGRPVELLAYITAGEGTQCPIARPEAIEQGASAAKCLLAHGRQLQASSKQAGLRLCWYALPCGAGLGVAGGHMRMGPPALAALAARVLRGRLLSELAAIEPRCSCSGLLACTLV